MAHGEAGKGSGRRKEDVSKVKSNWDLIDWSNKGETQMNEHGEEHDDSEGEWCCEVCGGPMYTQPHWSYGQCDDCGARQEMESDDY